MFPTSRLRLICVAAALALAGCLRIDQHITLEPDGSGRLEVHYAVRASEWDAVRDAASRCGDQSGVPPATNRAAFMAFSAADIRETFKTYERDGLRLDDVALATTDGWYTVYLDVHFRNLGALAGSEFLGDGTMSLTRTEAGSWVLEQAPLLRHRVAGDLAGDRAGLDQAMAGLLRDFRAQVRVTVPGDILSTTGVRRGGRTAAWIYEPARDTNAWTRGRTEPMRVEFSGTGLTLAERPAVAAGGSDGGKRRGGT